MKIALITDTHFGVRNDSPHFMDYFSRFFNNIFFPYCKENGITQSIHLGDLMDRRKYVNYNTLHGIQNDFIKNLKDNNIKMHCLIGNHDAFYKNTNKINSLQELFSKNDNLVIYDEPTELVFDDLCIGLVSWINKENYDDSMEFLQNCKCPIICGHFELTGYEVMRGVKFHGGMDDNFLKRFEMVLSGHFHSKSSKNNVHYLGTPYQMTFSDLNDKKGFHILDTETREIEFIENPERMFFSFEYDDTKENNEVLDIDLEEFSNKYIKLFVNKKENSVEFDSFLDTLMDVDNLDLTVIEDMGDVEFDEDMIDMGQDTISIISNEIDLNTDLDNKDSLKQLAKMLYMESLSL
jgi:DNA repair exonuclease SbcCD nuclease subunit